MSCLRWPNSEDTKWTSRSRTTWLWEETRQRCEGRRGGERVVSRMRGCQVLCPYTQLIFSQLLMISPTKMSSGQFTSPTMSSTSFWSSRSNSTGPLLTEQVTGVTTIARQQTGLGSMSSSHSDPALLRQLTGGGLSPTRQLGSQGLAKQYTGGGEETIRRHITGGGVRTQVTGGRFTRPKSVGPPPRHGKSVDEGRGMFLVRQMTGGTGSFQI